MSHSIILAMTEAAHTALYSEYGELNPVEIQEIQLKCQFTDEEVKQGINEAGTNSVSWRKYILNAKTKRENQLQEFTKRQADANRSNIEYKRKMLLDRMGHGKLKAFGYPSATTWIMAGKDGVLICKPVNGKFNKEEIKQGLSNGVEFDDQGFEIMYRPLLEEIINMNRHLGPLAFQSIDDFRRRRKENFSNLPEECVIHAIYADYKRWQQSGAVLKEAVNLPLALKLFLNNPPETTPSDY